MYSFEKLEVWQNAKDFTVKIYTITKSFPANERFGLTDQLRRAATSIAANIAEGSGRQSAKDQTRFYTIAYSSALEVLNFMLIAEALGYLNTEEVAILRKSLELITRQISKLRSSLKP